MIIDHTRRNEISFVITVFMVQIFRQMKHNIVCKLQNSVTVFSQKLTCAHDGNYGSLVSNNFCKKFRESNVLTKEITKELI